MALSGKRDKNLSGKRHTYIIYKECGGRNSLISISIAKMLAAYSLRLSTFHQKRGGKQDKGVNRREAENRIGIRCDNAAFIVFHGIHILNVILCVRGECGD